jgi:hypothetical protein
VVFAILGSLLAIGTIVDITRIVLQAGVQILENSAKEKDRRGKIRK